MPLEHAEPFERNPPISFRKWDSGTEKTLEFLDNDKDVITPQGKMFLFHVKEGKTVNEMWVKPQSAIAIGLAPFVPLKGKTLRIKKTGSGVKGTRYVCVEVKA